MPGGAALIDALADEIRRGVNLLPDLQRLDTETAAAAHSYCYWRYAADVVGRSEGIPRSAIERQFDRTVAPRDGAHKLQWMCPCCDGQAHYQVDGLLATQRPVRQGGFLSNVPIAVIRNGCTQASCMLAGWNAAAPFAEVLFRRSRYSWPGPHENCQTTSRPMRGGKRGDRRGNPRTQGGLHAEARPW